MKIKRIIGDFVHSPFHSFWQVSAVIFSFTYVLLAINSGYGFFGVMLAPDFMPALLFTLVLTSIFTIYAHELNAMLVLRHGNNNQIKLLSQQFCYGVVAPIILELLCVEIYFRIKSESILTNHFFNIDFILVVTYILIVNAVYSFANKNLRDRLKIRDKYKKRLIPVLKDLSILRELYRQELIKKAPVSLTKIDLKGLQVAENQIACLFKIDDAITICYFNQTKEHSTIPISKLYQALDPRDYIKINPYCCYHRLVIFSYEEIMSSRRLYLRLRHPFNHLSHDYQRIVSQSTSVNFKKWFNLNG